MATRDSPPLGLVSAKLQPPRVHKRLLPRPRLIEAVRGYPIVVVVADAGYGKSTFLVEWAQSLARVIWYTLDERDCDPTVFGQHLLAAAGAAPTVIRAWRSDGDDAADRLSARLLGLVEATTDSVGLVLDDFHSVADSPLVQATLRRVLTDRPSRLQIGIASRAPLPLAFARRRAHGDLVMLTAHELSFTPPEMRVTLDTAALDETSLGRLFALTGGWPAAVRLLGEAWAGRPGALPLADGRLGHSTRTVVDAFVEEEILARLHPDDLDLVARLSILEEIDPPTCQLLAGDGSFERLSAMAERFSFIADASSPETATYRIHPLMRQLAGKRLSTAERRAGLERVADLYETSDRTIDAGRVALLLGDADRLGRLVRAEASRLIARGHARTLAEWMDRLPPGAIEADPALLARQAQLEGELGSMARAVGLFERAAGALVAAGERRAAADALRVLAGQWDRRGSYTRAREALTRAVALTSEADAQLGIALRSQLAVLRLHDGDPRGAVSLAREVGADVERLGDPGMLGVARHNLGHILEALGRFAEAEQALLAALELKRNHGLGASQVLTLNSLGVVYQRQGRLPEAEAALLEAVQLAQDHGMPVIESYAHSNLGDVYRDRGDFELARSAYALSLEQKEAQGGSPFALAHTWNCLAALWRQTGDLDLARAFSQRALAVRAGEADPIERLLYRTEAGRIELAAGQRELATGRSALAAGQNALTAGPSDPSAGPSDPTAGKLAQARDELATVASELRRFGARYHALRAAWWSAAATWHLDGQVDADPLSLLEQPNALPIDDPLERSDALPVDGLPERSDPLPIDDPLDQSDALPIDDLVAEQPALAVAVWSHGCRAESLLNALVRQQQAVLEIVAAALEPGPARGRRASSTDSVAPATTPQTANAETSALVAGARLGAGGSAGALVELVARLPGNAPIRLLVDVDRRGLAEAAPALLKLRQATPPPLSISGFGPLRVSRRGLPIADRDWRRQRSLELLGLLLLAGPRGRSRDELIASCWPEAAPAAGVEQFHAHLHALRSALEPEAARGTSHYILNDSLFYRLAFELVERWDVGAFEIAVADARAADTLAHAAAIADLGRSAAADGIRQTAATDGPGQAATAERAYAAASQAFDGLLFDGLSPNGDWLDLARERVRRMALDARVRLARLRQAAGDPLGARDAWSAVLDLDPLRDDAHRGLLDVLRGLGQRDDAVAHFRAYAARLRRELDVDPSPETLALYRAILAT
jgi:LuxR family transcriptional regulator, maltose regulon positive regulatory protein